MRICIVEEIANCGFHLAKGLGERGHEVLVLLDRKRYENRLRFVHETPNNVNVKWLTPHPLKPRAFGLAYPLMKEIIQFNPHIIHVNYLWSQLFISQIAAWFLRVPIVGVGHGWEVLIVPHSKIRGFIQRFFLNRVDKVILTAEYYLQELDTIPEDKKAFIGRVVDTEFFNPDIDASEIIERYGENIITFIARLYKSKSPYTVLYAFRLVIDQIPDANLIIMGKGPERRSMERMVRKLNLDKNVHFLGEVPNPEIKKYLNASKAEVHGFQQRLIEIGISHLESLACGTPIITSYPKKDIPGVIYATDPSNIAQAIIKTIKDRQFQREISRRARENVVKNFSIEKGANETLQLYAEIFKERGILKD